MDTSGQPLHTSVTPPLAEPTDSQTAGARASRSAGRRGWRPSVRALLVMIVLFPVLTTAALLGASADAAWATRSAANTTADDAADLATVASARAELNSLEFPVTAVSYSAQLGISEPVLDQLLKPQTPFRTQLQGISRQVAATRTYFSTPTLRRDVAQLLQIVRGVTTNAVPYPRVSAFFITMAADIDNVWYGDYRNLQSDLARWQPPGSLEVHASALRQVYSAFLAGGNEVSGAIYVLEGIGPTNAKQLLIQADGDFQAAVSQFDGTLGPQGQQAWEHLTTYAPDVRFSGTIKQGVSVALADAPPPFAANLAFAGSSMSPSIRYVADLNALVTAGAGDLQDAAHSQATSALHQLVGEIGLLALVGLLTLGGTALIVRTITRSLRRLARRAGEVHDGNFELDALPETGPREVATTAAAFNDMTSTLRAVEARALALASEDVSDPALLAPLPGRTGRALQASVDALARQIREREIQRQMLNDAATHDSLTGLLNRSAVLEYLAYDVRRRREAGENVAVIFVDLDGLKPLNDEHGHEVGDAAILSTSLALSHATDSCDVVGRLGGDEFLVVLCHDHSSDTESSVQRIHDSVSMCRIPAGEDLLPLEASVGIAVTRCDNDTDPMTLVREADEAMYAAKKASRLSRQQALL